MTAREELAQVIAGKLDTIFGARDFGPAQQDYKLADALLAEGYRKPRTITTVEELDALPTGSVILDPIGLSLHKNPFTGWNASNGAKEITADMLQGEALPATVIYEPDKT